MYVTLAGMLIGGKMLSKVFSEPALMQLGFVSSVLSILLVALVKTTVAFFFGEYRDIIC